MGAARVGGTLAEVIKNGQANARVGGALAEVMKTNPAANARVGGVRVEVLVQPNATLPSNFVWGITL